MRLGALCSGEAHAVLNNTANHTFSFLLLQLAAVVPSCSSEPVQSPSAQAICPGGYDGHEAGALNLGAERGCCDPPITHKDRSLGPSSRRSSSPGNHHGGMVCAVYLHTGTVLIC